MNFWKRVEELLTRIERILAHWCVAELGISGEEWDKWAGHEMSFYRQCAPLVQSLQWEDVISLAGSKIHMLSHQVAYAYGSLKWFPIPTRLKMGSYKMMEEGPDKFRIWTYGRNDPIDVSRPEMDALRHFDGRPTQEVRLTLNHEECLQPDEASLRRWLDYAILVPA